MSPCQLMIPGVRSSLESGFGLKPPEAFGERPRDWSLGHAGDEGPHLSMTGESRGCLLPVIGLIFTVVSKLLLLYSTIDKTSTLKMKSFSTVRVTQRGSQHYMEKRRGRRELEVTRMR